MFIKPTKEANGSIFDIHDDAEDILIFPANEDVPCPWDPELSIEEGKVIITGGLGAGGPRGTHCRCDCLIEDFSKYYKLQVPDDNDDLLNALYAAGWERA